MRIGRKRPEPVDEPVDEPTEQATTMAWTNSATLTTRVWRAVILGCVLAGPIALFVAMTPNDVPPPAHTTSAGTELDQPAAASDNAIAVVTTWLEATRTSASAYTALVPGAATPTAETPATYRDPQVAGITPGPSGWTVTVAVDVQEPIDGEGEGGVTWIRRYFQVPIYTSPDGLSVALAAPAPVAAPSAAPTPETAYPVTVAVTSDVGESVAAFLAAMLTGEGELSRYTSPGAPIAALTPPGYTASSVTKIAVSADPVLDEGNTISLLVRADLIRLDGQEVTSDYALELTARGGRWEISAIVGAPVLRAETSTSTSTLGGKETP